MTKKKTIDKGEKKIDTIGNERITNEEKKN